MKMLLKQTISCMAVIILITGIGIADAPDGKIITPPSRVDRVMVYHDRALVTRVIRCGEIKPGVYDLIVPNMPGILLDESVRARIVHTEATILDVAVRTFHLESAPEKSIQELQDALQHLEDEKRRCTDRIAVLKKEAEFLEGAGESFLGVPARVTAPRNLGIRYASRIGIKEYESMRAYLHAKLSENAASILREEHQLRNLDKKIVIQKERLAKTQETASGLSRKKSIKATIEVKRPGPLEMELSYLIPQASWKPGYDIRILINENKAEFTGYGIVNQASGEDWRNSQIAFSTAMPSVRGHLPDLIPVYVTTATLLPKRPHPSQRDYSQSQTNRAILDNIGELGKRSDNMMTESAAEEGVSRPIGSLVFQMPTRADIPSDGEPHRIAISRHSIPVTFEYLSIPKISPYAHLTAVGKNNTGMPILQGDLNIFMGNDFIGTSHTGNILPNEEFELVLSVNENIRVIRTLEEKTEGEAGLLSSIKKTVYRFLITVENYTNGPIIMNIIDQVPVSRTDEVEIRNLSFSHQPLERTVKGICKWRFEIKAKETIKLSFGFTVAVSKDREAAFFRTSLPPSDYIERLKSNESEEMLKIDDYSKQSAPPALRQKK